MFEGKIGTMVSPAGEVKLPAAFLAQFKRQYGDTPEILTFGAQFLYVCEKNVGEKLIRRIDTQLLHACEDGKRQVTAYLKRSAGLLLSSPLTADGKFRISRPAMEMLALPHGGRLTLIGMEEYIELWNPKLFEKRIKQLEKSMRGWAYAELSLLELPICMQEEPCAMLKDSGPDPRTCGPCLYMRFP
jgi:DNA-binding transcriptional regulator/RsmH inhibitor MraZ